MSWLLRKAGAAQQVLEARGLSAHCPALNQISTRLIPYAEPCNSDAHSAERITVTSTLCRPGDEPFAPARWEALLKKSPAAKKLTTSPEPWIAHRQEKYGGKQGIDTSTRT